MHSIKKYVSGATINGCIAVLLFVGFAISGTEIASASVISEGFDSSSAGTSYTAFGFVPGTGTGGLIGSTVNATTSNISSPNVLLKNPVTGANGGIKRPFTASHDGLLSVWIRSFPDANFESTVVQLMNTANTASYAELQLTFARGVNGINCGTNSIETFQPYTVGAWYEALIEWRQSTTGSTEARCGVRAVGGSIVWSNWRGDAQNYSTVGGMQIYANAPWNGSVSVDNLYIVTDADYTSEPLSFSTTTQSSIQLKTRFIDLDITGANVAGGTEDITLTSEYYLHAPEVNTSISSRNPTNVKFEISLRPNSTVTARGENINGVYGTSTKTTTFTGLANGIYDVYVHFDNTSTLFGNEIPFKDIYMYSSFTIAGGVITEVGQLENYDTTQNLDSTILPCSLSQFGNCIINAFSFLFVPSTESTMAFSTTYSTLETKAPFVYVSQVQNEITSMWNTPSSFPTISIPFASFGNITLLSSSLISSIPFVGLIRTILGALIWIMVAMTIYRKTLRIFDSQTT